MSNYIPGETYFAYARSPDLCTWEDMTPVLTHRSPGSWDEMSVWAPFVYQEGNIFYAYYTGVTYDFTQSIMLATIVDPSDPDSWQPHGMIFQPNHPNMVWQEGSHSDCRDPTIFKLRDTYYLYYTGQDIDGGIVGLATATSLSGPWFDWGAILTMQSPSDARAESSTLLSHEGLYYLAYNNTAQGEEYRIGATPAGPWSQAYRLFPGWAHEFWLGQDGLTYTSFLTNNSVTVSRMTWDDWYHPAHPFIGENVYHLIIPLLAHNIENTLLP